MPRARKLASAALTAGLVTMGCVGVIALPAGAAQAATCPTASDIVAGINAVASQAGSIKASLNTLTTSSSPNSVQSAAQSTTNSLNTMSDNLVANASALNGCSPLNSSDAQTAATAFDGLGNSTNQMLGTLIGKHSIFAQFGVTAPINGALRNLEASVDSYTFALLDVAPTQRSAITDDKNGMNTSVGNASSVYSQLCIPSPLYPVVPPVCVAV